MDNLPAHKLAVIEPLIQAAGASILNLSPYSPDFNPIESCWSKLKEYLRTQEARTYEGLNQALSEAIDLVTDKDIIGWFTHCCYYVTPN